MQYEFNDKGFYIKSTFEVGDHITIWENDGFLKRSSYYIKAMNEEEVILETTIPSVKPQNEVRKILSYRS
jgi:tRNA splicing endonuclease